MKKDSLLRFLHYHPQSAVSEIKTALDHQESAISSATLKRLLSALISDGYITVMGQGRSTRYSLTPQAHLLMTIDVENYFQKDIDEREVQQGFNFDLIENLLTKVNLFTEKEKATLESLHETFTNNIKELTACQYHKEMERLGIDLSWKSSQIEGNTYSLLETERLLKEKQEAEGKSKEEAIMLLNHKEALRFIFDEPEYLAHLTVSRIEDIHSVLIQDLAVDRNIRYRRAGIIGTNYRPIDNEFQIREAMTSTCDLINGKENVFEKALLALVLLSYIQPFTDGNKRTARIVSNALMIANGYCPLSFRTVDSIDYKKAMLLFYEQNNISAFKEIFMDQYKFAMESYF